METKFTVSFEIYNTESVKRLQEEDPDILPSYSVDAAQDLAYNKKQISAAITAGIIQGKSIDHIADDLQSRIETMNRVSAIRTARTAITNAQSAGTLASMKRLAALGVEVQKEWMATLDSRTRESHRNLDGERRELDERFSNGLMYPGASGSAKEVYNCRCTMVSYLPKYDSEDEPRETYNEWKRRKNLATNTVNKSTAGKYVKETQSIASSVKTCKNFDELETYFQNTHSVAISKEVKKLDFEMVKDGLSGVDYVLSEFPQTAGTCDTIFASQGGLMTTTPNGKLGLNSIDFNDRQSLADLIVEASNIGYFVKNATIQTIGAHEGGHILELALIRKSVKSGEYADAGVAWDNCIEAARIISEACSAVRTTASGKNSKTGELYSDFELKSQVSTYALEDESECMAECVHDYVANGNNASVLAKAVWKILKGELG